jgi:aryl-phospho-beta-D-glucosidase BglC (GH1 family)
LALGYSAMSSLSVAFVLLVSLFLLSKAALARPQIRNVVLQIGGTGNVVDEVAVESTITMTTHRTATVSLVQGAVISDSASEVSSGTGSVATESLTILPTISASSYTLSTYASISTTVAPTNYSSSVASTSSASTQTILATPSFTFVRGVSLGGWLILEKWMNWDAFTGAFSNAVDQWTFDSIPGAEEALMTHWSTYFTEDDINTIAATGINALRIPIGFWAYGNSGTPYIQGADAFLEKAIGWAKTANMKV